MGLYRYTRKIFFKKSVRFAAKVSTLVSLASLLLCQ